MKTEPGSPAAIVLLSGGQDSTTCLYWALREYGNVIAIGFNYGQKHVRELEQAKLIAAEAGVEYRVIDLRGVFGGSSLVNHTDTNKPHEIRPDLPSSFTAGRNMVFLGIAAGIAFNEKIDTIITGVCETDFSGYPDCRRAFIDAMELAASAAVDSRIDIITPLMYLSKAETWKLANDMGVLDVIIGKTLTDYNGDTTMNDWGMGKEDNPATVLRAKGYREAKAEGWV